MSRKWLKDWWAQDVDIIGRTFIVAGIQCVESKREPGIWLIEQTQIIKLGRTESAAKDDALDSKKHSRAFTYSTRTYGYVRYGPDSPPH